MAYEPVRIEDPCEQMENKSETPNKQIIKSRDGSGSRIEPERGIVMHFELSRSENIFFFNFDSQQFEVQFFRVFLLFSTCLDYSRNCDRLIS